MAETAMWFILLSHLEDFLAGILTAAVSQGFTRGENYPSVCPAIRLYRRGEPDLDVWSRPKGKLEIIAELWVKNDDPDPKVANQALAELEKAFQDALVLWPVQAGSDLKLKITDMNFSGVNGDNENYRPHAAAFYGLRINWAK